MSGRLYPHGRIRYWYAYDIEDICTLFNDLGLHPQTVRKWIKDGLPTVDTGKPILIYGNNLIEWLKKRNYSNKCSTELNQMFCMKCQDARQVFQRQISIDQNGRFLKVKGICRNCKTIMNKNYKLAVLPELRQLFKVVDVLQLDDSAKSTCKTHFHTKDRSGSNKPEQGELFPL